MLYQVGFCHVRLRTNHLHWNLHRNQVIQKRYVNACLKHFYRQTISIQNTETVLHKRGKTSSNMEFSFKNVITKISILIRAKKSSGRVSSQASLNQHHSALDIQCRTLCLCLRPGPFHISQRQCFTLDVQCSSLCQCLRTGPIHIIYLDVSASHWL